MATVRVVSSHFAAAYESAPRERLLYAGLRNGIWLPHECGSGTCGRCRATLVEGTVVDLWPDSPGKQLLKPSQSEILLCQSAAAGDVVVAIRASRPTSRRSKIVPGEFGATIRTVRRLTHDVMEVSLALDRLLEFDAGQFALVRFPCADGYRAYSMVNCDSAAAELTFVVRRKPSGEVSEWLFGCSRAGEKLALFGPLGDAILDQDLVGDIVCIAGGSGIAGIMAIIRRAALERKSHRSRCIDVFFGVRTPDDLFYAEELHVLRAENPTGLRVTVAMSDEPASPALSESYPMLEFASGLVHDVALERMAGNARQLTAFLAGPPAAVDAGIRGLITKAKFSPTRIRFDRFS